MNTQTGGDDGAASIAEHPAGGSGLRRRNDLEIIPRGSRDTVTSVSGKRLFLGQIALIDSVIDQIAHRNRLGSDEASEFRSHAHLKLIEDDYAVLRQFRHRSSLRTYLTVVLQRLFLDHRNKQWGRWRPSMEARRSGPVAVHLERLLTRDGIPFSDAVEVLRSVHGATESTTMLQAMADRFPQRLNRRLVGEDALSHVPDDGAYPDEVAARQELKPRAARAMESLERGLRELPGEDRLLIRLCFWERMTVAQAARALALEQKPLYRRLERLLKGLRDYMEQDGVAADARELREHPWADLVESSGSPDGLGERSLRKGMLASASSVVAWKRE